MWCKICRLTTFWKRVVSSVYRNAYSLLFFVGTLYSYPSHVYQQEQDSLILNSSKLDFVQKVYSVGSRAHYVDIMNIRNDRSMLAKIRVSAHDLATEKVDIVGYLDKIVFVLRVT